MVSGVAEPGAAETRVGIISDTHGRLNGAVFGLFAGVHCIFHAGDIGDRGVIRELDMIAPVYAIRGNTDPYDMPFPEVLTTQIAGLTVHMRHLVATGATSLYLFTQRVRADIVLFGHTHEPFISQAKKTLFLNPGSASKSRIGADSAALVTIVAGVVSATVHDLIPPDYRVRKRIPETEPV